MSVLRQEWDEQRYTLAVLENHRSMEGKIYAEFGSQSIYRLVRWFEIPQMDANQEGFFGIRTTATYASDISNPPKNLSRSAALSCAKQLACIHASQRHIHAGLERMRHLLGDALKPRIGHERYPCCIRVSAPIQCRINVIGRDMRSIYHIQTAGCPSILLPALNRRGGREIHSGTRIGTTHSLDWPAPAI